MLNTRKAKELKHQ